MESKEFFEVMHSLLTAERTFLHRERGWLLAPCAIFVGLTKQLHVAKPETVLFTDLAEMGSELLPLIEKYLTNELQVNLESDGIFDSESLTMLVSHICEFPKLAGRLYEPNDALQPWRLAQLSTIFSMSCQLTRLIHERCRRKSKDHGWAAEYERGPHVDLVSGTLELATVLIRLKCNPQGGRLKELLELIHDHHMLGIHEDDGLPSLKQRSLAAKLYELLRDFFVAFYKSNDPKNFETNRPADEEAVIPRLLFQYMIQHWNAPPFEVPEEAAMSISLDQNARSLSAPLVVDSRAVDSPTINSYATHPHAADSVTTHPPAMHSPTTDTSSLDPPAQKSLTADHPVMDPLDTNLSAKDPCNEGLPTAAPPVATPPIAGPPAACPCTACSLTSNRPVADSSASGLPATQCVLAADASL
jgi:hypothetical protein